MTPEAKIARLARAGLAELARYEIPHPEGIRIRLDANELPYALPDEVAAELGRRLARVPLHRYPDGDARELRGLVSRMLDVDGKQVVFGNGSDELISLLVTTFARPRGGARDGAGVLYPWPSFVVYRIATHAAGCQPVEVPLGPEWALDPQAVFAAIEAKRPNLLFFARPNNPTGTLWPRELLLDCARKYPDLIVVSDEAYVDYAGDTLLPELAAHPNLVIMRTLSKIGMAALRTGFVVAHPAIVHELEKIRPPYNLGALNQAAACFLLGEHEALMRSHIAEVVRERDRLYAGLATLPGFHPYPSAANLVCVRVGTPGDGAATATWQKLAKAGILVRNFDRPGPLSGHLRITVGTPEENRAVLEALAA